MLGRISLYKSSPTNSDGYEMIQLTAYMLSNMIRLLLRGVAAAMVGSVC